MEYIHRDLEKKDKRVSRRLFLYIDYRAEAGWKNHFI